MILFNEFKCIHKNQCQEFYYFTYYQRPTWTNLGGTKEEKWNSESSKVTMKRTFRTDGGVLSNTFICSAKDRPEYMGRTFRCFFMPYRDRVRACSCRRDTTFSTSSWRSRLNKKRRWQEVRPKRKVDKKKNKCSVRVFKVYIKFNDYSRIQILYTQMSPLDIRGQHYYTHTHVSLPWLSHSLKKE